MRTTPFPSDVLAFKEQELIDAWRVRSHKGIRLCKNFAKALIEAAQHSIGVVTGLTATRLRLNDNIDQLDQLEVQIKECEELMSGLMDALDIDRYLVSIPGVGKVVAAGFIAETGDLSRFSDWKQLQRLAGLNLTEQSSGQHKSKTKVSKRGRPGLRCIVYQLGDKGMLVNPEMRLLYNYFQHRENNPLHHTQAIIAIGLKLLRIMFHAVKLKPLLPRRCFRYPAFLSPSHAELNSSLPSLHLACKADLKWLQSNSGSSKQIRISEYNPFASSDKFLSCTAELGTGQKLSSL